MSRPRRGEQGQATVELALLLPLVAVLALAVAQVVVVGYRQVLVVHAAREGARSAAVSDADRSTAARRGAERAGGLDPSRLDVDIRVVGDRVEVAVRFREPTDVPVVGRLVPDLQLAATTAMRIEGLP